MTPHPDDEYIITDFELTLFVMDGFWDRAERMATYKQIISRPHSKPKEGE